MNLTLRQLEAEFAKLTKEDGSAWQVVENINEADGVSFLCPTCFKKNNGPGGTHMIMCWQPHVPQTVNPVPGRWKFLGTGLDDLELRAGSSSVALITGCKAHFFVRNGEIIEC